MHTRAVEKEAKELYQRLSIASPEGRGYFERLRELSEGNQRPVVITIGNSSGPMTSGPTKHETR